MTLYVSGPITGTTDFEARFAQAAAQLVAAGYRVVNPVPEAPPDWTWAQHLRRDLVLMLGCDGVAALAGWERSRGALLEHYVAVSVRMPYLPLETWLERGASR